MGRSVRHRVHRAGMGALSARRYAASATPDGSQRRSVASAPARPTACAGDAPLGSVEFFRPASPQLTSPTMTSSTVHIPCRVPIADPHSLSAGADATRSTISGFITCFAAKARLQRTWAKRLKEAYTQCICRRRSTQIHARYSRGRATPKWRCETAANPFARAGEPGSHPTDCGREADDAGDCRR